MRILLTGALVLDGTGRAYEKYEVGIDGEEIVNVGPAHSGSRGFDRVIDTAGKTVMPGMVDTHVHFGGGDFDPAGAQVPVGLQTIRSLEAAQRSLLAGCTTVRSAGAQFHLDVDVRDAITQGIAWGPRIVASGRGITHTGGHASELAIEADGQVEITRAVRALVGRGVDSIKLFGVSAGVATAGADVGAEGFSVEEIRAAIQECRRFGKLDQVHSIGLSATKNAIAAGVSSIDHGHFLDEEVCTKMKADGIVLVPTFGPTYYYTVRREAEPWRIARAEAVRDAHVASFRLALELGVSVAMGSDLGFASRMKNGENALELTEMVEHGMKPEDAIVAATGTAARLLRRDDVLGTLKVGKMADVIVVDGNPAEDIKCLETSVEVVMKGGVIYRGDS